MSGNPPDQTPTSPGPLVAPVLPVPASGQPVIGNPRDIQGIMGLGIVGGTLALGAVVIVITPSAAVQVFTAILGLAGSIVGFYFGVKSQQ